MEPSEAAQTIAFFLWPGALWSGASCPCSQAFLLFWLSCGLP
jgi:hypothetical protein